MQLTWSAHPIPISAMLAWLFVAGPALRLPAPPKMSLRDQVGTARTTTPPVGGVVPDAEVRKTRTPPPVEIGGFQSPVGGIMPTKAPSAETVLLQGGSLRTWSYSDPSVEQVQVVLCTDGRQLDVAALHSNHRPPLRLRHRLRLHLHRLPPL